MGRLKWTTHLALPAATGLTGGIFLLDLMTPLGIAVTMLYPIPVALTFWAPNRFASLWFAVIGTGLTILGFFLSPLGLSVWISMVNRSMSVGTSWVIAALVLKQKHAEEEILRLNAGLEQRVADRTAQLTETNTELEAFSYSVSHDLRAPLRHIDGFVDLLHRHVASSLDEKGLRYLKTIATSAKQMGVLIDDLLVFSRMGRADLHQTRVSLDQLVKDVLNGMQQDTQDRHITWTIGALPVVHGDPSMLRLVLANLISNAVKYTRPRATASIEVGCDSEPEKEVVIFVRDNGVGFDMQYAHKLFGVFQRLHSANAFEGTGIGLANVHRIINRHGGKAWATGQVDQGATFFFSLPKPVEGEVHG